MRIILDREKCTGHGRCYSLVPSLFEPDDEGYGVLIDPNGDVPAGQEDFARRAMDNCPERAISIEE